MQQEWSAEDDEKTTGNLINEEQFSIIDWLPINFHCTSQSPVRSRRLFLSTTFVPKLTQRTCIFIQLKLVSIWDSREFRLFSSRLFIFPSAFDSRSLIRGKIKKTSRSRNWKAKKARSQWAMLGVSTEEQCSAQVVAHFTSLHLIVQKVFILVNIVE